MVNVNDCVEELAKYGIDGTLAANLRAIQVGCKRSQTLDEIVERVRVSIGITTLSNMLSINDSYSVDEKELISTYLREGAHTEDVFALIRPGTIPNSK
jgi:hypothetical protein